MNERIKEWQTCLMSPPLKTITFYTMKIWNDLMNEWINDKPVSCHRLWRPYTTSGYARRWPPACWRPQSVIWKREICQINFVKNSNKSHRQSNSFSSQCFKSRCFRSRTNGATLWKIKKDNSVEKVSWNLINFTYPNHPLSPSTLLRSPQSFLSSPNTSGFSHRSSGSKGKITWVYLTKHTRKTLNVIIYFYFDVFNCIYSLRLYLCVFNEK
jgi:hypothetical protein